MDKFRLLGNELPSLEPFTLLDGPTYLSSHLPATAHPEESQEVEPSQWWKSWLSTTDNHGLHGSALSSYPCGSWICWKECIRTATYSHSNAVWMLVSAWCSWPTEKCVLALMGFQAFSEKEDFVHQTWTLARCLAYVSSEQKNHKSVSPLAKNDFRNKYLEFCVLL